MPWTEIAVRTMAAFAALLLLTRLMGHKQMSQLTFFNYITGITIGNIAAYVTIDNRVAIGEGLLALAGWTGLTVLAGIVSMKSSTARALVDGQPIIVIKKGQMVADALRKARLNTGDLTMMLCHSETFDIQEVDYAILEPNGKLSIMKKPEYQHVVRKDMSIPVEPNQNLPAQLIIDGQVLEGNLQEIGRDRGWLEEQVLKQGYQSLDQVFYAELETDASLFIMSRHPGQDRLFH